MGCEALSKHHKYHNFSFETISQCFNSTVDFNKEVTVKLPRYADLIKNVSVKITLPQLQQIPGFQNYTNATGYALLEEVSI